MKRIAVVSLLITGLFACRADEVLPPRPSAMIQDAGHNGGNYFFAFLQPIVSQPTTNGVFDPNRSPTVKVEFLWGDASCSDPHLTYTMSTGPGGDASETVRVNATDHNYIVNFHTDKVAVTSGCTYRIRVFIGSIELGFADIELFLTQKEAKNLTSNETVALVDGKTLPIKFWIAQGVLRDFGQGTASPDHDNVIVTQNGRAGVFIPKDAVTGPTTIIIESVDDRPCFPSLIGHTFQGLPGATGNSCYRFRTDPLLPDGKFNKNVTVGICVDLVAEPVKDSIRIFQFDEKPTPQIQPLVNVPAPFLPCDPGYQSPIGLAKPGLLNLAARAFGRLLSPLGALVEPRPLFASTRTMVFDLGAGGSTDGFSLFTWGLVTNMAMNDGDGQSAVVGTPVETPPSVIFKDPTGEPVEGVPVTFTVGDGDGHVTGETTTSGPDGIARVGSWTLGSVGTNTLIASAPDSNTVTPTSVTFSATGVADVSTGTVAGTVTDAATRQPVAGAVISVQGTALGAITNAAGLFLLTNVPTGSQTIQAAALGYLPQTQVVNVVGGQTATADLELTATPPVTVDGILSEREWDGAVTIGPVNIALPGGGTTTARVLVKNSLTTLFVAVEFAQDMAFATSVVARATLDENPVDGAWNGGADGFGDDGFAAQQRLSGARADNFIDMFFNTAVAQGQSDVEFSGTNNGTTVSSRDGSPTVIEMSHPLSSPDFRDAVLAPGDPFGLAMIVTIGSSGTFASTWLPGPESANFLQLRVQ